MSSIQWQDGGHDRLRLDDTGIEIRPQSLHASDERLYRLWVGGHNYGLYWELDMAKECAERLVGPNADRVRFSEGERQVLPLDAG